MGKIYFWTVAYNAEKTLARCVDSVLRQSFRGEDVVFYLCDNGSTDATGKMIREYAARDPRIRASRNEKNGVWGPWTQEFNELPRMLEDDDYLCALDSDDCYDLDFLETMLPFMEHNALDIGVCGTAMLDAETGWLLNTRSSQRLILERKFFAELFPFYLQFMRPLWAKLFSGRVAKHMFTYEHCPAERKDMAYGGDTIDTFSALRHAQKIGFLEGTKHTYYVSNKSRSYVFNRRRIEADLYLYRYLLEYLEEFGPISADNQTFLYCILANALHDSSDVIACAQMTAGDKLRELQTILEYDEARCALRGNAPEQTACRKILLERAIEYAREAECDIRDLRAVLEALAPTCGCALEADTLPILERDPALRSAFLADDAQGCAARLLELIRTKSLVKQFDLIRILRLLTAGQPIWDAMSDLFIRRHAADCLLILNGAYEQALDSMTGELLKGKTADETYLQLYLQLAAIVRHEGAFLYGKECLATLYRKQGDRERFEDILRELAEMGVDDGTLEQLRAD